MKTSEFKSRLETHSDLPLAFTLPDGSAIPAHFHITEVGRVDKTFLDCGGEPHLTSTCLLQAWVAKDTDHRLDAGKLRRIFDLATPILEGDDLDVEVEYEPSWVSQFAVESAIVENGVLHFQLGAKHTDCLAKDTCLPAVVEQSSGCSGGSGCC